MEELLKISNLKRFLQGDWRLERQIDDRRGDDRGRFEGGAAFLAEDGVLLYREDGRLSIGGHEGSAMQFYTYAFPETGKAEVSFRDGRFFHDLDLTAGIWTCHHRCGEDDYAGEFRALDADLWRVVWQVKGPRKDLVLDGLYRRLV